MDGMKGKIRARTISLHFLVQVVDIERLIRRYFGLHFYVLLRSLEMGQSRSDPEKKFLFFLIFLVDR